MNGQLRDHSPHAPSPTGREHGQLVVDSAGALYRSLPGEYFAMLLAAHAALVALAWTCYAGEGVWRFGMIAAATWVMIRVVGVGAKWFHTPVVTLALLGITVAACRADRLSSVEWLVSGPFSAFAIAPLLAVVLFLDIVELAETRGQRLVDLVRQHGLRLLSYGIAGAMAIYVIVVPLVQELVFQLNPPVDPNLAMDRLTLTNNMLFKFVESFTAIWFLVLGTVVGSYLNVVIYRVPLGISVIARRSHCPGCGVGILASDNLPVIGWLRLNGRCRNCDAEISTRYPTVEIIVGLMFLLLFFVELISGGTNLPVRRPNTYAGVQWILFYTKWDLVGLYVYHCFLLSTLIAWAMIRRDGHRVPVRTSATILTITIVAPLLLPHLLVWPFNANAAFPVPYSVGNAVLTSAMGVAAAAIVLAIPRMIRWARKDSTFSLPQFDPASWLVIGAGLGWQAVAGILVLLAIWSVGCGLVVSADRTERAPSPGTPAETPFSLSATELRRLALPCVVLIHHCLWRQIAAIVS